MDGLGSMPNIGKHIESMLISVGITSPEELIEIGSKEAFVRIRLKHADACLMVLYSLQGAVDNIAYSRLSPEVKQDLKAFCSSLK